MAEKIFLWVQNTLCDQGWYNYLYAFGILILCGFGLPVPEDITLVAGGLVSGLGATNPHVMLAVCFAGVLLGDSIIYIAGKLFGYKIQKFKPIRKILSPRRFAQVQRQFAKYGIWVLFAARFMPGLRAPIFLVSGMSRRIPFIHFLMMDGLAALISVPVWVYLGYFFANQIPELLEKVKTGQSIMHIIIGFIICIVLFFWGKHWLKGYWARRQAAQEAAQKAMEEAAKIAENSVQEGGNQKLK